VLRAVRFRWNRFGPMFAAEIRKRCIHHRSHSCWRWHLDEVFVRIWEKVAPYLPRIGPEAMERILKTTVAVALANKTVKPSSLERVTVDTTVQPKAIAHPTDGRLYLKALEILVCQAKRAGITLRQSHTRLVVGVLQPARTQDLNATSRRISPHQIQKLTKPENPSRQIIQAQRRATQKKPQAFYTVWTRMRHGRCRWNPSTGH